MSVTNSDAKLNAMAKTVLQLMIDAKTQMEGMPELNTVIMNLTTVSKEINSVRLKKITGDDLKPD